MKVAFHTLGCKVNQCESAAMAELFLNRGYEIVDFNLKADIYVINTCNVTNESARKSRQWTRKAIRRNPNAKIIVIGCYSQIEPSEVSQIPGVDIILGTKNRHKIVDIVEKHIEGEGPSILVENIMNEKTFEDITFKGLRHRTRAFLKIQEGCNAFCSYCIIPYARGPVRSRTLESIIKEAKNLAEDGFKEIILTGIHLGLYGQDFNYKINLFDVISEIAKIDEIKRVRLSSIEINDLNDEFIKRVSEIDKFCPHFHIPLQSGSDKILKLMNRHYDSKSFLEKTEFIKKTIPGVSITTDVIVGFPGETEKNFNDTFNFIKKVGFSRLHVFPFSPRKGTKAYDMPHQIHGNIKDERSNALIKLSTILEKKYQEQFLERTVDVLFEKQIKEKMFEGLTPNYIKVCVKSSDNLQNKILPVTLTKNHKNYMVGKINNYTDSIKAGI